MYAFNPPFKFRPLTQIQSEARRLFRRVLGQIHPWAMHARPPARPPGGR